MSPELLNMRKQNFKLYRLARAKPSVPNKTNAQIYRNYYNSQTRRAKKDYFETKIREAGTDSRRVWDIINQLANKPPKQRGVDSLVIDDVLVTSELEIANKLNQHFATIGPKVANTVPTSDVAYREFFPPRQEKNMFFEQIS